MKHIKLATLLLFAAVPLVVNAKSDQSSTEKAADEKEMAEAREELRRAVDKIRQLGVRGINSFTYFGRGRLGLLIGHDEESKGATEGLHVQAVTPGGPADKAGIKAGDILTAVNGKSLASKGNREEGGYHLLVAEARHSKAGEKVTLEYRRGSAAGRAEVVVESGDDFMREHKLKILRHLGGLPESWSDLELVSLNSDLGQYFGTTDGVLVVRAPESPDLPLKAGDVIQKIGDRKPASPTQAVRILASYNPGDTVKVEITRQRKSETLSIKIPNRDSTKM